MALTVAQIAAQAMDAVSAQITDAIHSATLSYETNGAYDFDTGEYTQTTTTLTGGRVVAETERPPSDIFPDYVVGPGDELLFLDGFTDCKETWTLTANGRTWVIRQVQDIVGAGSIFYAIGRRSDV